MEIYIQASGQSADELGPPPPAAPLAAPPDPADDPPAWASEAGDDGWAGLLEDFHGEEQLGGDMTPVFDEVAFAEAEQAVAEADGLSMEAELAQPAA